MASDCIYRNVDVRALAHFHDGDGGLSVNAERVWMRLLTDEITTPVPGLVLARRMEMVERCRLTPRQFDEAFAELSGFKEPDGTISPMAVANWPLGVVVLPAAPRMPCHRPKSTSRPVEWARFFSRSAPRCQEVDQLRAAWREALVSLGDPKWVAAFDSESRGPYSKRSPKPSPTASANNSPNNSPNASPNGSPTNSDRFLGSRESGVGKEEPASGADTRARGSTYGRGELAADWWRLVKTNPGDPVALGELLALMQSAATARSCTLPQLAEKLLPAIEAVFAEMKARGVHRGAPSAADLARKPDSDPGRYFNQALERVDGKAPVAASVVAGAPVDAPRAIPNAAETARHLAERAARARAAGPVGAAALELLRQQEQAERDKAASA